MNKSFKRAVEVTLFFTGFIGATYGFGIYLLPAIVETMRAELGFSYSVYGNITGATQLSFLVFALASGVLTIRIGALGVIFASVFICALGLGGMFIVQDVVVMAFLLIVLGGCAASVWVPMVEVSQQLISPAHQGKALGLMSSGTSYGVFINSLLISSFLIAEGWRFIWGVTFVIVFILFLLALVRLWSIRHLLNVAQDPSETKNDAKVREGLITRMKKLPRGMALMIVSMMFLNGLSCIPFQNYLSAYLLEELQFEIATSATAWRIIGITGMFGGFAMGALADRITIKWALVITFLFLCAAPILLLSTTSETHLVFTAALCFGLAFYAVFGLFPAYISRTYARHNAALVFAMGTSALGIGGIAGNILGGHLKVALGSFDYIYIIVLCSALISTGLSLAMPREGDLRRSQMAHV